MELTDLFQKYPLLREMIAAAAVIFVNICALIILIAARRERRFDDRKWAAESRRFMLQGEPRPGKRGQERPEVYSLGAAEIVIGRHPSADIRFPDSEISRFHALLTLVNGTWTIEDIGAENGVSVNDVRIRSPRVLHLGDCITVGKRRLTVIQGTGKGKGKGA